MLSILIYISEKNPDRFVSLIRRFNMIFYCIGVRVVV